MHHTRLSIVVGALMVVGCTTSASLGSRRPLTGVRFRIGTVEIPAPARGALGLFDGVVDYAAGRGRINVNTRPVEPPIAVQGVIIAAPLGSPGDYYLFDSTGFVLVRPASRTFSTFVLSESSYRLGDVPDPREGFMEFSPLRADTLATSDSARLTQHGPFTLRWHLDRRQANGPARVLARGWIELPDARAGEGSVVRWYGAAAVLAQMSGSLGALRSDSLRVTAAIVLPTSGGRAAGARSAPVTLIVLHPLFGVTTSSIDPARMVLPAGFMEKSWPMERASPLPASSPDAAARWRTMPAASHR